jgi:hypothetical protein
MRAFRHGRHGCVLHARGLVHEGAVLGAQWLRPAKVVGISGCVLCYGRSPGAAGTGERCMGPHSERIETWRRGDRLRAHVAGGDVQTQRGEVKGRVKVQSQK